MVFTHGGLTGGYGIYLRDGKAHFVYNLLAIERFTISSRTAPERPCHAGSQPGLRSETRRARGPAAVTITANGKKVAEGKLPRPFPFNLHSAKESTSEWTPAPRSTSPTRCHFRYRQNRKGDGRVEVILGTGLVSVSRAV